jgi:hypothetical protein
MSVGQQGCIQHLACTVSPVLVLFLQGFSSRYDGSGHQQPDDVAN